MNKTNLRIALIGNRILETDHNYAADAELYNKVCNRIMNLNHTMVSGMAYAGPDAIAQKVFSHGVSEGIVTPDQMEIYVDSQKSIDKSSLPFKELAIIMPQNLKQRRLELLQLVMHQDHISRCNDEALGKHERNVHQVLGIDLNSPVDACITWCSMNENNMPKGGTATAYNLCLHFNIPVFNLWYSNKSTILNNIAEFLKAA